MDGLNLIESGALLPSLAYWFMTLAVVSGAGVVAAFDGYRTLLGVFATMATGSVVAVMALGSNSGGLEWLAAGTLIASAVFGVYAARRPLGKGVH